MDLLPINHAYNQAYLGCVKDGYTKESCNDFANCVSRYWEGMWGYKYVPVCIRPFIDGTCHHAAFYDTYLDQCAYLKQTTVSDNQSMWLFAFVLLWFMILRIAK